MPITMPIVEVRNKLTTLLDSLEQIPEDHTIAITKYGKPILAIMSWESYEALIETLEIISDSELMEAIQQGNEDIEAGRVYSMEEVKKELEL